MGMEFEDSWQDAEEFDSTITKMTSKHLDTASNILNVNKDISNWYQNMNTSDNEKLVYPPKRQTFYTFVPRIWKFSENRRLARACLNVNVVM